MRYLKFLMTMLITACVFSVVAQATPIIEKSDVVTYSVDIQDATIAPQAVVISDHYLTNPAHERWCVSETPEADAHPGEISLSNFDLNNLPDRIRPQKDLSTSNFSTLYAIGNGGRLFRINSFSC